MRKRKVTTKRGEKSGEKSGERKVTVAFTLDPATIARLDRLATKLRANRSYALRTVLEAHLR